jgi:hypothetical protein
MADPVGGPFFIFSSHATQIWSTESVLGYEPSWGCFSFLAYPFLSPFSFSRRSVARGRHCGLLDDHETGSRSRAEAGRSSAQGSTIGRVTLAPIDVRDRLTQRLLHVAMEMHSTEFTPGLCLLDLRPRQHGGPRSCTSGRWEKKVTRVLASGESVGTLQTRYPRVHAPMHCHVPHGSGPCLSI